MSKAIHSGLYDTQQYRDSEIVSEIYYLVEVSRDIFSIFDCNFKLHFCNAFNSNRAYVTFDLGFPHSGVKLVLLINKVFYCCIDHCTVAKHRFIEIE